MTNDERAQIRAENERLRQALRKVHDAFPVSGSHRIERMRAIALDALLRLDPAEASEPLQSARPDIAPVDHGPRAAAHGEAGTLHEPTVRACIAKLPATLAQCPDDGTSWHDGMFTALAASYGALLDLLPKPDPAKELVDAYREVMRAFSMSHDARMWTDITGFVRWLIDTGRLRA